MVPTLYSINDDVTSRMTSWTRTRRSGEAVAKGLMWFCLVGWMAMGEAQAVTLEQAFASAEQNNIDLALSGETVSQARAMEMQAMSGLMPRLSASASFKVNQDEVLFDMAMDDLEFAVPDDIDPVVAPLVDGVLESSEDGFGQAFDFEPVVVQPK
jgi:hypothetical protein